MELFRKYEFLNISVDVIQGYAPETGFWFVSVDVIRPNVGRNTRLLSGNKFFASFCGRRFCSGNTFVSCLFLVSSRDLGESIMADGSYV